MTESAQPVASTQPVVKARSPVVRGIYFVLGLICLGFAYLSFLPGIPTFDFVILAAFFFARSSDRFHNWLVGCSGGSSTPTAPAGSPSARR